MSDKYTLNREDVKKQLRACFIWLAPLAVLYLAQLQGALIDHKTLTLADLAPNELTLGGIQLYFVNQAFGLFQKFIAGK